MLGMCVGQVDVKSAFLNGDLCENVWVSSPHGIPCIASKRYKLCKAMYGLKQTHLAWHIKLCSQLKCMGFVELPSAPCVFSRRSKHSPSCFILVYVDDLMVLTRTKKEQDGITRYMLPVFNLLVLDNVACSFVCT